MTDKFKVGDLVRAKWSGRIGLVTEVEVVRGTRWAVVFWGDDRLSRNFIVDLEKVQDG